MIKEFDYESKKIAEIFNINENNRKYLKIKKSNTPLVNSFLENGKYPKLIGKQSGKEYDLNPPKFECVSSKAHNSLSCSSCHTGWAPQCVGCHTEFQPDTKGYDLLENKDTDSAWVEYHGEFFAELPTLGVLENSGVTKKVRIITTFIPGMIMTLDKSNLKGVTPELIFKRLFAPASPHTIRKESRTCESCHNNPLAIGYGRGKLRYVIHNEIGKWIFNPQYTVSEFDNIPEDGWIGFLSPQGENNSTRENTRPFNIEEQRKILQFGACLTCHKSEEFRRNSLISYENQLDNITKKCIIPSWN